MPEKMSSIEKVIGKGLSEKEKGLIIEHFKEEFDNQKFEKLRGLERKKTAEELEIISLVNEKTNELLEKFGLKKFDVPAKNIYIIPKEKWIYNESCIGGFFVPFAQAVGIKDTDSKLYFLKEVFHEILHFKSGSVLLTKKTTAGKITSEVRLGFFIYEKTGGKKYFGNLNEAITEECVKRLMISQIKTKSPLLKDDLDEFRKNAEKYPPLVDEDTIDLKVSLPGADGRRRWEKWGFTFPQERRILNTLIDKLYERNKDGFKDREEVFDLFAKAMLEGNIIEVGYLVDKTFGKGTMRTIGELEDDISAQEKYVKLL